ncbi:dihydrodipicolinate reductase [Roseivivax marinus]|uniref:4-hydroxy-tetrahydrodipicolinate reductase n=1 Tax=Roseivivax marinus TaxID=1379903 RepID=UPI0008C91297|nr:4-hydroxy-tetrahydrodipicolinate reductase [Roseivivax marinus]SEK28212.1 dihydrodipicolinate reductase [Roseivivax marinus]
MSELPGVAVIGPSGRMGRMLVAELARSDRLRLAGALVRPGHDWAGRDLGAALGGAESGLTVTDDPATALEGVAAVIDFTAPETTLEIAEHLEGRGAVHVIGTTGFDSEQLARLDGYGARGVQVRAGNMSLGVNLLVSLTRKVAEALDADWDVEVIEAHHNRKADAPSGTALMLGEAAAAGRGVTLDEVADRGRDGITGPRERGHIGFSAVRGGDIVGEHDVLFAGAGERIVLRHMATDRGIFARGALKAALWGLDREPGTYDMADVLGL